MGTGIDYNLGDEMVICNFCGEVIFEEVIKIEDRLLKPNWDAKKLSSEEIIQREKALEEFNKVERARLEQYLEKSPLRKFLDGATSPELRERVEKYIKDVAVEKGRDENLICEVCFKKFRDEVRSNPAYL